MLHRIARLTALIVSAGGLTACIHVVEHDHPQPPPGPAEVRRGNGPPPHAPAHGYRRKQQTDLGSVDLVFDSGLGVYVVVGWPDHYWYQDRYYRWVDGVWMASAQLDAGWLTCSSGKVPPGLVKKHATGNGKAPGGIRVPASHRR
jgi:hypothetical protein